MPELLVIDGDDPAMDHFEIGAMSGCGAAAVEPRFNPASRSEFRGVIIVSPFVGSAYFRVSRIVR